MNIKSGYIVGKWTDKIQTSKVLDVWDQTKPGLD
jgi:hypothetical protein